jgi:hypothetical protein
MRLIEFFEGDDTRLSMTRLLCFISIFPASYALIRINTEGALAFYIGGYVLGYVGGKGWDAWGNRPMTNNQTTINQPEKVNVAGDVKA